ncbi:MAG TPA: insulinase family protein [Deltaproteobacteria bacterium]|nr:insulinase family protein [Deltaproteobacteria bacterium]
MNLKNIGNCKKIISISLTLLCVVFMSTVILAADTLLSPPDKLVFPALEFDIAKPERIVLENGIVLFIMEDHELPVININGLIRTGSIYDPQGKEGVAELTGYMMRTGGTSKLTGDEIDERLDFLAATATISISSDHASVSLSVLNKDADEGIELLSQMLMNPAFDKNKLKLAVQLKQENLRRLQDNPQRLAFREFNKLIYKNNPRGRFPSQKSLSRIKRGDLVKFHHRFFRPNNTMFAVTGNITKEEAVEKFTEYFGSWKKGKAVAEAPQPEGISNAGIYYIDRKLPQSTIVLGQFAPAKLDRDFYAFTVLDFVAGSGGFNSRIFEAVRSNEGLAYSAGSFYRARPTFGVFGAYAFTKTSSTLQALGLINSVLDEIRNNILSQRELEWAKQSINNGFIFSFTSAEQIAIRQMNSEFENLPSDYMDNYTDNIEKVTSADLNRLAQKYLDKSNNVVLILGDTGGFEEYPAQLAEPEFIIPII